MGDWPLLQRFPGEGRGERIDTTDARVCDCDVTQTRGREAATVPSGALRSKRATVRSSLLVMLICRVGIARSRAAARTSSLTQGPRALSARAKSPQRRLPFLGRRFARLTARSFFASQDRYRVRDAASCRPGAPA